MNKLYQIVWLVISAKMELLPPKLCKMNTKIGFLGKYGQIHITTDIYKATFRSAANLLGHVISVKLYCY